MPPPPFFIYYPFSLSHVTAMHFPPAVSSRHMHLLIRDRDTSSTVTRRKEAKSQRLAHSLKQKSLSEEIFGSILFLLRILRNCGKAVAFVPDGLFLHSQAEQKKLRKCLERLIHTPRRPPRNCMHASVDPDRPIEASLSLSCYPFHCFVSKVQSRSKEELQHTALVRTAIRSRYR